ncbi:MAG: response regulator [Intestinibacter sp.]
MVLDIMMPKVNGIEVCKKRQNKNMPIFVLSAKSEDMIRYKAL